MLVRWECLLRYGLYVQTAANVSSRTLKFDDFLFLLLLGTPDRTDGLMDR